MTSPTSLRAGRSRASVFALACAAAALLTSSGEGAFAQPAAPAKPPGTAPAKPPAPPPPQVRPTAPPPAAAPPAAAPPATAPAAAPPAAAPPAAAPPPAAGFDAPTPVAGEATATGTPPAAAARPTGGGCGDDLEPVASQVELAIVSAESPSGRAQGFAFGDASTFVVPSRLAVLGRDLVVRGRDGVNVATKVRAVDEERGIAIVEADYPVAGVKPLSASDAKPRRGMPVLAFGQPWAVREPANAVTPGVVSAVEGEGLHVSAIDDAGSTWGTPLVDCEGRVVGMVDSWDNVVAVSALNDVAKEAAAAREGWSPGWRVQVPVFFAMQFDDDFWMGGKLGIGASYDRKLDLLLQVSAFGLVDPKEEQRAATVRNHGHRLGAELTGGYRFLIGEGAESVHLVPTLGAAFDYTERFFTAQSLRVSNPDCSPEAPCAVERLEETVNLGDRARVMPLGGLGVRFHVFEMGWAFRLDVEEVGASTHEVRIGGVF